MHFTWQLMIGIGCSFMEIASCHPFGGVLSSVTDQLAYARFHFGDGRAASGERVMSKAALRGMWSRPGPGGPSSSS